MLAESGILVCFVNRGSLVICWVSLSVQPNLRLLDFKCLPYMMGSFNSPIIAIFYLRIFAVGATSGRDILRCTDNNIIQS